MLHRAWIAMVCCAVGGCTHLPIMRTADSGPADIQQLAYSVETKPYVVYVMSNGFHSGLVLKRSNVPEGVWPEIEKLPEHDWVEVGWGSEVFYRAKKITPGVVVGALVPNPSVLHIVGWDAPPSEVFPGDLIRLEVDVEHFQQLCQFIHSTYKLTADQQPEDLGQGIYGDSRFYRAKGLYYFPNTCNMWTARALSKSGVPIIPEVCSTADAVLSFARRSGEVIHRR